MSKSDSCPDAIYRFCMKDDLHFSPRLGDLLHGTLFGGGSVADRRTLCDGAFILVPPTVSRPFGGRVSTLLNGCNATC